MPLARFLNHPHTRRVLVAGLLTLTTAWATAQEAKPLQIVTSFSILADMTREIAGESAVVTSLVAPNADAHVFEPSPAHAKQLKAADLVVLNGLQFEGWIDRLIRSSGYKGPVVLATAGIKPRQAGSSADPHAWQSLSHAERYVSNIAAALSQARPAQAPDFQTRARAYIAKLQALDVQTKAQLAAIPPAQRRVITSHDAFAYLGEAYGITFIAPQGWNTNTEASARTVAAAIRQIKSSQARALFVENITDRRLIDRIAQETGATVGGTLYSDALSPPGTEADTYLKLYAHNLTQLLSALSAPPHKP